MDFLYSIVTMSEFTTDDLTKINTAIASGQLEVRFGDRTVRYQSTSDMIKARDIIRADLGVMQADTRTHSRTLNFVTSKGL